MADIKALKAQRGRVKASLTRLKTFATTLSTEQRSTEEIETRLEYLERYFIEFTALEDQLVALDVPSDFEEYEDLYMSTKPVLMVALKSLKIATEEQDPITTKELNSTMSKFVEQQRNIFDSFASQNVHRSNNSLEIRLPKVQIEAFSGDYKDWPSFKDLFVTSVDKRDGLSDVHKLQYLKGLLKGEAAALIKHITVTEHNYQEAWSKLAARYDKKKHILTSYIKSFVNQPSFNQSSSMQLRQLTDSSDELIRGIKALGEEATSRDPWLIHLVLNKTDPDTRQAWAEEMADKEFPSYQELLNFLCRRCDALEAYEPSFKKPQVSRNSIRTLHSDFNQKCPKCSQNHQLFFCPEYKALNITERRNFVTQKSLCFNCLKSGHLAQKCSSKHFCHHCKRAHHSTLHTRETSPHKQVTSHHITRGTQETTPSSTSFNPHSSQFVRAQSSGLQEDTSPSLNSLTAIKGKGTKLAILPTALVNIRDVNGTIQPCRVLIDSGSQGTFITEDCAQRLGFKRNRAKVAVFGLGSSKASSTKGTVMLTLTSRFDDLQKLVVQAYILDKLTSSQPTADFNINDWNFLNEYQLADPYFNQRQKVDILLGVDHFIRILLPGQHIISPELPALQNTVFGYIVAGSLYNTDMTKLPNITTLQVDIIDIDNTLKRFWETEELPPERSTLTVEEQGCEDHFQATHYVDKTTGKYTVSLPFKEDASTLGNSRNIALKRLLSLERRFLHNPQLKKEYCEFIEEYQKLGHLEPTIEVDDNMEHAYLPHHAVLRPCSTTTKLRVVFDGSVATSTGISLNQKLQVGPKIQRDLFQILLSFRTYRIAITADIEKMFRMILVNPRDRTFQRIVWRKNPNQPAQNYWLNTVTYGTAAAPFLATRSLHQLTIEFKGQFPLAEKAITNNFYVDDLLAGAHDIKSAIQLQEELNSLLQLRGFSLRKWASNSEEFLNSLPSEKCGITSLRIDENPNSIKVLGLNWIPFQDNFTFEVQPAESRPPTKRIILSESSRIFDPLGLLAPIIVLFKIILQRIWIQKLDWDEVITGIIKEKWNRIRSNLHHIQHLQIPRWLGTAESNFEIHGFSDASECAYAAAVYCRSKSPNCTVEVTLIAAKTRVCPIQQTSIPRLELCGALLLVRLMSSIKIALEIPEYKSFAWTDSKVVLSWLSSHPRKWKCYVGNRTSEILKVMPRKDWNYVPSKENPADLASRGITPNDLKESQLWWHGPPWLKNDWTKYVNNQISLTTTTEVDKEMRPTFVDIYHINFQNDTISEIFEKISSFHSILRIIAFCLGFIRSCKKSSNRTSIAWLAVHELHESRNHCIRWAQSDAFSDEIMTLQRNGSISKSSKLLCLSPFLDQDNILRVGGRIERATCSYDAKHPVILPKEHIMVKKLIAYVHEQHYHVGTSLLISILRQSYWILSGRLMVKSHISKCVTCVRQRAATSQQLMANLPYHRVSFKRCFDNVGVDYAVPIPLLLHRGRGARGTKGYISLFVCLSTKALHLEVVSDLSADAFIACLKRFIARRGVPSSICSDNGTNFVGAKRQLDEVYKLVKSTQYNEQTANFLSSNNIEWRFNPPSAPHFGGIWEAAVRSVKMLLRRTIGETRLTYEELSTLVTQIEGVLNSRPLTPATDDITSLDVITPGHFLIGQPITTLQEKPTDSLKASTQNKWRLIQKLRNDFWKRWHKDYLTSLQNRPKWTKTKQNLTVGDMVVIKDENRPPAIWSLGRVVETHPGSDHLVRVVTVRTQNGTLKRPIAKLVRLPVS